MVKECFLKISAAERHKLLLHQPEDDAIIYKIMTLENFKKSFEERYLYFNRVDGYEDDCKDSSQPEQERLLNCKKNFLKSRSYTLENKNDDLRKRVYACCFSLNIPNSEQWEQYGGSDAVCLELNFGKLKSFMNSSFESMGLKICGLPNFVRGKFSEYIISEDCNVGDIVTFKNSQDFENAASPTVEKYVQFFDLNYGKVIYGDFGSVKISDKNLANSIKYVYFKDSSYQKKDGGELRISLMSQGVKNLAYSIDGGSKQNFNFPESLNFCFDFCLAIDFGVVIGFQLKGKNSYNYFQSKILKNS